MEEQNMSKLMKNFEKRFIMHGLLLLQKGNLPIIFVAFL